MAGVLDRIPFLAGYQQQGAVDQQRALGEGQQVTQAMGILGALQQQQARAQAAQREQQMRGVLSTLGPDATPEQVIGAVRQFASPDDILKLTQGSMDRKAAMDAARLNQQEGRDQRLFELNQRGEQRMAEIEAAAREGRITREDADRRSAELRRDLVRMQNEGRRELLGVAASLRAPPQPRNLQLTTDAEGNQLIVNPDGTTRPLTTAEGGPVRKVTADRPMTEFQGKAALYGTRAATSDKILANLEDKISTTGLSAAQKLGTAGNFLMSSEQQRVSQAQRDFVNAVLRQESGAVISDAEFENAKKQYFPAPGDDKTTIDQKRANRRMAIAGFKRMSGPRGSVDIDAVLNAPLLPGGGQQQPQPAVPASPKAASIIDQADAIINRGRQ